MESNRIFERYRRQHPEWSDAQIWAAVSIEMEGENVIGRKDGDIEVNDPDIIREILDGARNWLRHVLPEIFAKVADFFERAIATVGDWVRKGLAFVIESLAKLLGKV